jgi:hypothetical protein
MQLIKLKAPDTTSPDTVVLNQLRTHWLAAIFQEGPIAARDDAVVAFTERMHCSRAEAEDLVDKAWCMLKLKVHAASQTWPDDCYDPSADALKSA